jgi:hypothetical protein
LVEGQEIGAAIEEHLIEAPRPQETEAVGRPVCWRHTPRRSPWRLLRVPRRTRLGHGADLFRSGDRLSDTHLST